MSYYVYILTSTHNNVFYVGVSNNLERRIFEHSNAQYNSFCRRYNIIKLVYFEECFNSLDAIQREKQIKKWRREKKIKLIEAANPTWEDLQTCGGSLRYGRDDG
ncbi:GIY-YIG nuclease family protein [Aliikangiella marina]|uniref:GIY-YIG nuclease family protein n=1 Tax=Aliikangiella marina TaxID=1712262 RepID=A0A545T9Z5_9GAMM|nr:GIY-YIG nuclease family protein [Aliikangiella marina]